MKERKKWREKKGGRPVQSIECKVDNFNERNTKNYLSDDGMEHLTDCISHLFEDNEEEEAEEEKIIHPPSLLPSRSFSLRPSVILHPHKSRTMKTLWVQA